MEIIVVDDGSTDETRAFAERARAQGLVDMVICHGTRCGRSAAINAGVRFARGDLILTVDADTEFEPTALARLAAVFEDPRVGGASCNIAIRNDREFDLDRPSERRVPDVDHRGPLCARRRRRHRVPVRRLLDVPARRLPAAGRPRCRARAKISNSACDCAASVISSALCRTPWRKPMVRQAASAFCVSARAGTAMRCVSDS